MKSRSFVSTVIESLGKPLLWGTIGTVTFYSLILTGIIQSEMLVRYFAGHPVEYIETALFFVGLAALGLKAVDLAQQFRAVTITSLPAPHAEGDEPQRAGELMDTLAKLPAAVRASYLARRLQNTLRYVQRGDSASGIEDQLRYLSDVDVERADESYALVRMIVWATPMLGFLGTVIGITLALGDLSPEALIDAPKEAMQGLLGGLSIAFDTTAIALSLSIALMFVQFLVRQVESQLLIQVDRRVEDEMTSRFQQVGTATDPGVSAVQKMSQRVLRSVEALTERQTQVLTEAVGTTQTRWSEAVSLTQQTVQASFEQALNRSVASHADAMLLAENAASEKAAQRWARIQEAMSQQYDAMSAQHSEMNRQGEVLLRVLDATGDVITLQSALNQNLSALAGAKNFEDTVMSLSATIQLLSSRLGVAPHRELQLDQPSTSQRGRAA